MSSHVYQSLLLLQASCFADTFSRPSTAMKRKCDHAEIDQQRLLDEYCDRPQKTIKTATCRSSSLARSLPLTRQNIQRLQNLIEARSPSVIDAAKMPARSPTKDSSRGSIVPSSDSGKSLAVLNAYSIYTEGRCEQWL